MRTALRARSIIVVIVAIHMGLLSFYTFPPKLVPGVLRSVGQLYARPLFHQQWRLFAPDPPLCSCGIEARWGERAWSSIQRGPDTYLDRRTAQAVARHVQSEVQAGDTIPAPVLIEAMRSMALYSEFEPGEGRVPPVVEFRLVERCVVDPERPSDRVERITPLHIP